MGQFIKNSSRIPRQNLWAKYQSLSVADQQNEGLVTALRQLDLNVNVNWPLVHYKSAVRYLSQDKGDVRATGEEPTGNNTCHRAFRNASFFQLYGRKKNNRIGEDNGFYKR